MSSNTHRLHMKYVQQQATESPRHVNKPSKVIYINKFNTISKELDILTETTHSLRDIYEKKIQTLTNQNEELKKRNDELIEMNNCLLETEELESNITDKLNIYKIDEE